MHFHTIVKTMNLKKARLEANLLLEVRQELTRILITRVEISKKKMGEIERSI